MAAHNSTKSVQYREHPNYSSLIVGTDGSVHQEIRPDTRLIGVDGNDWSWAFVVYRDVPDFPGYRVGSDGSVWSCRDSHAGIKRDSWHRLSPYRMTNGYCGVMLSVRGRATQYRVHVLVLETFFCPRPAGLQARHFPDPDRLKNTVFNLCWGTREENEADKRLHGTFEASHTGLKLGRYGRRSRERKLTEPDVLEIRRLAICGISDSVLARSFGVCRATIYNIVHRKKWAHV
jgi:hypothetical protein